MNKNLKMLCEGAVMIALAMALSYVDIPLGFQGGSINLTMIPLLVFALRYGCVPGMLVGLVFGTMKFFFAGGTALNWVSMLFDYSVAYAAVGVAGLFRNIKNGDMIGTVAGGLLRFIVHFISGVTVYAEYAESTYLGLNTANKYIYSAVYNGVYMLPSIVICIILVPVIYRILEKRLKK